MLCSPTEFDDMEFTIDDYVSSKASERHKRIYDSFRICPTYVETGTCPRRDNLENPCPHRHSRGEKSIVCKHWLRGLCKKEEDCEFLHMYDMTKLPPCHFFSTFGKCNNPECLFLHLRYNLGIRVPRDKTYNTNNNNNNNNNDIDDANDANDKSDDTDDDMKPESKDNEENEKNEKNVKNGEKEKKGGETDSKPLKTVVKTHRECQFYRRGYCMLGDRACPNRHVERIMCPDWLQGCCPRGGDLKCPFEHPRHELPTAKIVESYLRNPHLMRNQRLQHRSRAHRAQANALNALNAISGMSGVASDIDRINNLLHGTGGNLNSSQGDQKGMKTDGNDKERGDDIVMGGTEKVNSFGKKLRPLSEVTCYKCGLKGHYANSCPAK